MGGNQGKFEGNCDFQFSSIFPYYSSFVPPFSPNFPFAPPPPFPPFPPVFPHFPSFFLVLHFLGGTLQGTLAADRWGYSWAWVRVGCLQSQALALTEYVALRRVHISLGRCHCMPWLKLWPFCLERFSKKAWNPNCGIQYGNCCLLGSLFFHVGSHDCTKSLFSTSKGWGGGGGGRPTHPPPWTPPP